MCGDDIGDDRRLGHEGERSFATDEQSGQTQMQRVERVPEMVAAAIHEASRPMRFDQFSIPRNQIRDAIDEFPLFLIRILAAADGERFVADAQHAAIAEDDLQLAHASPRGAVAQPVAAAGIDANHAPQRRHRLRDRIGPEHAAFRLQHRVQAAEHDARLQAHKVIADLYHAAHVAREIDDQARPKRFAGEPGPRAAGMERNLICRGILYRGHDVGGMPRPHDAERPHLMDAGVAGIHLREQVIAKDLAGDEAAKVVLDALSRVVHGDRLEAGGWR